MYYGNTWLYMYIHCSTDFTLLGTKFSLCLENMIELNLKQKLQDITKLLKSWKHRKLSLLLKVPVVKSLLLPKNVHLLTSLPNPNVSMLNDINRLFYSFI